MVFHQCGPGSIPDSASYVGWVCNRFSSLLRGFFCGFLPLQIHLKPRATVEWFPSADRANECNILMTDNAFFIFYNVFVNKSYIRVYAPNNKGGFRGANQLVHHNFKINVKKTSGRGKILVDTTVEGLKEYGKGSCYHNILWWINKWINVIVTWNVVCCRSCS